MIGAAHTLAIRIRPHCQRHTAMGAQIISDDDLVVDFVDN